MKEGKGYACKERGGGGGGEKSMRVHMKVAQ